MKSNIYDPKKCVDTSRVKKMSIFTSSTSLPFSPTKPPPISAVKPSFPVMGLPQNTLLLAGVLSLGLVISPPSCIALESSRTISSAQLVESSSEVCKEEESEKRGVVTAPELVSNDGIVEQVWEIVNETFLDPSGSHWSPQSWLVKFSSSLLYIIVYKDCVCMCIYHG